jgi:hypothetical protein
MAQERRNREMMRKMKEQSMRNQGLIPNPQSTKDFKSNLNSSLPKQLRPGNIGQINQIVWPFWFTFSAPELVAQTASSGFLTITQEAGFILLSITKSVFIKSGGAYTYVDPNVSTAAGDTDALKFTIRDAQSSRVFHNLPMELDMVGHPEFPTVLPSPLYFLPNSTIEITYQNDNPSVTYVPFVTFFGYRIRMDDPNILSTVVG